MTLKVIDQIKNLADKRVLLRLDLNVPLDSRGQVAKNGDWRLNRAIPTIKYLSQKKAKIIIVAHLGRPKGKPDPKLSLLPVAKALAKKLGKPIKFWSGNFRNYQSASLAMRSGEIAMLENIRFEPREKLNDQRLARDLSKLADLYVNDAFGNLHRADSSMEAITHYLPSQAGFLIREEIKHLSQITDVRKGLVIIFGGAKASTKMKLIKKYIKRADSVLLGGALANTILKSAGYDIGRSLFDPDSLKIAKELLGKVVQLPVDVAVATRFDARQRKISPAAKVAKQEMILDIGPATVDKYIKIIQKAQLVIWNGPFGYFENSIYMDGSKKIMQALAKSKAKVILGGGETVELAQKLKLDQKFDFISTGGGAMLTFLGGEKMPSLARLKK